MLDIRAEVANALDWEVFDKIKRNCPSCSDREPCALDLKRDPNTSMWEAYCPNSDVLNVLVVLTEVIR